MSQPGQNQPVPNQNLGVGAPLANQANPDIAAAAASPEVSGAKAASDKPKFLHLLKSAVATIRQVSHDRSNGVDTNTETHPGSEYSPVYKLADAFIATAQESKPPTQPTKPHRHGFWAEVGSKVFDDWSKYFGGLEGQSHLVAASEEARNAFEFANKIDDLQAAVNQLGTTLDYLYYTGSENHLVPHLKTYKKREPNAAIFGILNKSKAIDFLARHLVANSDEGAVALVSQHLAASNLKKKAEIRAKILTDLGKFLDGYDDLLGTVAESVPPESIPVLQANESQTQTGVVADAMSEESSESDQESLEGVINEVVNDLMVDVDIPTTLPAGAPQAKYSKQKADITIRTLADQMRGMSGIALKLMLRAVNFFVGADGERRKNEKYINDVLDRLKYKQREWNYRAIAVMQLLEEEKLVGDKTGVTALVKRAMQKEGSTEESASKEVDESIRRQMAKNNPKVAFDRLSVAASVDFNSRPELEKNEVFRNMINDYCIVIGKIHHIPKGTPLLECQAIACELGIRGIEKDQSASEMIPFIIAASVNAAAAGIPEKAIVSAARKPYIKPYIAPKHKNKPVRGAVFRKPAAKKEPAVEVKQPLGAVQKAPEHAIYQMGDLAIVAGISLFEAIYKTIFSVKSQRENLNNIAKLSDALVNAADKSTIIHARDRKIKKETIAQPNSWAKHIAKFFNDAAQYLTAAQNEAELGVAATRIEKAIESAGDIENAEVAMKKIRKTLDYLYYNAGESHDLPGLAGTGIKVTTKGALSDSGLAKQLFTAVLPGETAAKIIEDSLAADAQKAYVTTEAQVLTEMGRFIDQSLDEPIEAIKERRRAHNIAEALGKSTEIHYKTSRLQRLKYAVSDLIDHAKYILRPLDADEKPNKTKRPYEKLIHEDLVREPRFKRQTIEIGLQKYLRLIGRDDKIGPFNRGEVVSGLFKAMTRGIVKSALRGVIKMFQHIFSADKERENTENYVYLKIHHLNKKQVEWNRRAIAIMRLLEDIQKPNDPRGVAALIEENMASHSRPAEDIGIAWKQVEDAIQERIGLNTPKEAVNRLAEFFELPASQLQNQESVRNIINNYCILANKPCYIAKGTDLTECTQIAVEIGIPGVQSGKDLTSMLRNVKVAAIDAAQKASVLEGTRLIAPDVVRQSPEAQDVINT